MKKRDYVLTLILILCILGLLYFLRHHGSAAGPTKPPPEAEAPKSATVVADEKKPGVLPGSVLLTSADPSPARPHEGFVLYSRPPAAPGAVVDNSGPNIKYLRSQKMKNPAAEFDSLKELKSVTISQMKVVGNGAGGTDVEMGETMNERLIGFSYFADRSEGVRFFLIFDLESGVMLDRSCFAYKGEVFHGPEKEFSVRTDNEDYIVIAAGDKYYLRAKFTGQIEFEGLLYGREEDNWRELTAFDAYGIQQRSSKMDLARCEPAQ